MNFISKFIESRKSARTTNQYILKELAMIRGNIERLTRVVDNLETTIAEYTEGVEDLGVISQHENEETLKDQLKSASRILTNLARRIDEEGR
jgi:hypothetical protein